MTLLMNFSTSDRVYALYPFYQSIKKYLIKIKTVVSNNWKVHYYVHLQYYSFSLLNEINKAGIANDTSHQTR